MKAFKSKGTFSTLFTFLFFLIIASLIAIKVNYFTDLKYQTSSRVGISKTELENQPVPWPVSFNGNEPSVNPELLNLLTETVREHGWNIEFYHPHPAGNRMIVTDVPLLINYFLKSTRFTKQDFEIEIKDHSSFTVAYQYGGIKRIRTVRTGQPLNEIELNLTLTLKEPVNPVILNDYRNRPVIASIYSPQAFAEKLLKHHLSVACRQDASTLITITYPDARKAKMMADELAHQLAQQDYQSKNKRLDQAISKLMNAEINPEFPAPVTLLPQGKIEEALLSSLLTKRSELSLQLKALDNLHDYLRQNRIEGNAVPAFGTLNDPVFAGYITALNSKIHQLKTTTQTEEQQKLNNEIEFLKNTLAEGMRNTRKTVALQMDETSRQIAQLQNCPSAIAGLNAPASDMKQQLARKRLNLLLDKKAEAAEIPSVTPAPLPLNPENPDHAAVWLLCILSACVGSWAFRKIIRKKEPVTVRMVQDDNSIQVFTSISAKQGQSALQVKQWAEEILNLHPAELKPCMVTLTHAVNNSSSLAALELALAATASGKKVLMMDANLSKEQLSTLTGTEIQESLTDMLVYGKPLQQAMVELTSGLKLICVDTKSHDFHPVFLINKIQELVSEEMTLDMVLMAAPAAQDMLTLPLIRISHSAFVIHTTGQLNKKITQRWKNIFRIEHVYDVESDNTRAIPQQWKSKGAIRSIRNRIHSESKPLNWFQRAALWFY
jgi:hypothetical protein